MTEMQEKRYVAVICEYNPFHFGHLHQINRLKEEFDGVVCIMSGNFVQRGSLAVADKYIRAEAAVRSGANLVVELPFPWCASSARDFAKAGVHIAAEIGVSHLAFGAEDSLESLCEIQSFVSCDEFSEKLKNLVKTNQNLSYPQALKTLVAQRFGEEYAKACEKPNNILGLEYLSALESKNISPIAVKREPDFKSSSMIRSLGDPRSILENLPEESRAVFGRASGEDFPRDIKKLDSFFIASLRRMSCEEKGCEFYSTPYDLYKKLIASSVKVNCVDELISACTDKVYTAARVRRALLATVFGVTSERLQKMPTYTCVLASDEVGRAILKNTKKNAQIDIITKPVKALTASKETAESFAFSKSAEDVAALSAPNPLPSDAGKTPFVK